MMKEQSISYGIIIKNLRLMNKLSQSQLGKLINVSKSTISAYECETTIPSTKTLFSIFEVCNANIKIKIGNKEYSAKELSRELE